MDSAVSDASADNWILNERIRSYIERRLSEDQETHTFAVLTASGSFSPVHTQHLRMFIEAKKYLENTRVATGNPNIKVLAGFFLPSLQQYVDKKLGKDIALPWQFRVQLCEAAALNPPQASSSAATASSSSSSRPEDGHAAAETSTIKAATTSDIAAAATPTTSDGKVTSTPEVAPAAAASAGSETRAPSAAPLRHEWISALYIPSSDSNSVCTKVTERVRVICKQQANYSVRKIKIIGFQLGGADYAERLTSFVGATHARVRTFVSKMLGRGHTLNPLLCFGRPGSAPPPLSKLKKTPQKIELVFTIKNDWLTRNGIKNVPESAREPVELQNVSSTAIRRLTQESRWKELHDSGMLPPAVLHMLRKHTDAKSPPAAE